MRLTTPSALRLGGAAVALVAAAAGTLVSAPAHADGLAATSIAVRAAQPSVAPGGTDTITGDLAVVGGTGSGRTVTLQAHTKGTTGFAPVGDTVAGTNGGLALQVTPEVTTLYRWHYDGAADARPSTSGTVRVSVSDSQHHPFRLSTTLSIRASQRVVAPNGVATVRGHLRSGRTGLPNRQVLLLAHPVGAHEWNFVRNGQTGPRGAVAFSVSPDVATAYRLQFLGSQVFQPSHSGVVTIGARTTVDVAASPTVVAPGGSTIVSATATHKGTAVVGATARLLARKARPHSRFHVVGSGTTSSTGTVAFVATPKHDTRYRVRVLGSSAAPGGLSPVVRVDVRGPHASSLSIRGRDARHHRFAVSGNLRSGGHAVRHAVVSLWSQAPGSTVWTKVSAHRTGHNGVVQFRRPQSPGTAYRLSFEGNQRYAPTLSGTVVN